MFLSKTVRDTLWTMIVPPTVWALHFLVSYVVAAYVCAPNTRVFEPVGGARAAIGAASLLALAVILFVGVRSFREWRRHGGALEHSTDSPEGRERFLEFSTLLLVCLSFVGVVFDALPALFITDCR